MTTKHLRYAVLALCAILLAGCASLPAYDTDKPRLSLSKANEKELLAYGNSFVENPYLEPRTLIRGKLNEFHIVKLSLNLPEATRISIIAEAKKLDGSEAAKVYDQNTFAEFWDANTTVESTSGSEIQKKNSSISRSCIPAFSFTANAGQSEFYIPFVGRNPIPRPAKIYVQVSTGSGEPCVYTATLE